MAAAALHAETALQRVRLVSEADRWQIMFSRTDFDRLIASTARPAVTLLMPAHVGGREVRQDPARFRKLVERAESKLAATMRSDDARLLMEPARKLAEDAAFWTDQSPGLAVFAAPRVFEWFRLPFTVPEEAIVGRRFHVLHLMPHFEGDGRFLILAVSARRARLFEATRHTIKERSDVALPAGVAQIRRETDYDAAREPRSAARRTGSRGTAGAGTGRMPSDSFGDPEETRKTELIEYLSRLADALVPAIAGRNLPIVLAAHDEIQGQFRRLERVPNLMQKGVVENPETVDDRDLLARAYAIAAPRLLQGRTREIERFGMLLGEHDARASQSAATILEAAQFGRVETLFVADGAHLWGGIDPSGAGIPHDPPEDGDEELLDFAVAETLRKGGAVHVVPQPDIPWAKPVAAIFRY